MIGVVKGNRLDQAEDDAAEYELHDTNALFSTGVNLIPAPNAVQGTRHLYGNKFFEQALPLQNRESPLVKALNNETGRSWDWEIGKHLGIVRAEEEDEGSVVEDVTPDELRLRRPDGSVVIRELFDKFPSNRNTLSQSYARVKKGDTVHKGQTLAPTNFTDDEGRMALGLNARIALVPFKGHSMDDAAVISNSFAERLRSMHAATVEREHDDLLKGGKTHFTGLFHKTYTQDQLDKLDDGGLPVPGQTFQPGDPLILQTRPRTFSSNKVDMSRLSKAQRFVRKDASIKWEGLHPATVIEVVKTKGKGHKVLLEYTAGVEPGDKLTLRPGQKSYHPDTEVFTARGWSKIPDLTNSDRVAALFESRGKSGFEMRFTKPLHANTYVFDGELYGMDSAHAAYLVTGNHRIWCKGRKTEWACREASEMEGSSQQFMSVKGIPFDGAAVPRIVTGRKADFYREKYHGNVYCLQVPGVGVILTRFRGKVMWNGNSTVSKIIEDDKMPRTRDGVPLEMLLNQLSLPSRVNSETFLELMLGKIARKTGKPYVLPQFLPKGKGWNEFAREELEKHGLQDAEDIYDPEEDVFLEQPVSTGEAYVMKLHHMAGKKMTARGQKGYTIDEQPMRGKGQAAQRISGLEMSVLHSSGGRGVQKESVLLRGERRDEYWKKLRANRNPGTLEAPFVWEKFKHLLQGAGVNPRDMGGGKLRLTPMTNAELELRDPVEIQNEGIIDLKDFEPKPGGLFDPMMVREGRWGFVKLKRPAVNPAYEDTVRTLLGLTKDEYEKILDEDEETV